MFFNSKHKKMKDDFNDLLVKRIGVCNPKFIKDFVNSFTDEQIQYLMMDPSKALYNMYGIIDKYQLIILVNISLSKICIHLDITDPNIKIKRFTRLSKNLKDFEKLLDLVKKNKIYNTEDEIKRINNIIVNRFIEYMGIDIDTVKRNYSLLYL